jgi:hypothetical protein
MKHRNIFATITLGTFGLLASTGTLAAQTSTGSGGWRTFDSAPKTEIAQGAVPPPPPSFSAGSGASESAESQAPRAMPVSKPIPDRLTVKPGTFVSIRVGQMLSSDRNHEGDAFFGTLAEPIVVDGIVVAARGEQITGRISKAKKAGLMGGTSELGVELAGLTLVDGSQVSVQSQMVQHVGPSSVGRNVGAVATTTGVGAVIGAVADNGRGAAIGAGAGAAAGLAGVLLTRGRPTEIYPETTITFRMEAPLLVDTTRAPQVFRYADTRDYAPAYAVRPAGPPPTRVYTYPAYPYPVYPRYYDPFWGPGYWGPSFGVVVGRGYGHGGFRR